MIIYLFIYLFIYYLFVHLFIYLLTYLESKIRRVVLELSAYHVAAPHFRLLKISQFVLTLKNKICLNQVSFVK